MPKTALITGITGQDGAYLTAYLLNKGYHIHGIVRRTSGYNMQRLDTLGVGWRRCERLHFHEGDLTDSGSLMRAFAVAKPDEVYNLAAQSHVHVSFESPEYTANVNGLGATRLLEAIRMQGLGEKTRFYQASTSEIFGKVRNEPQNEATPFYPRSPYGVSKVYAFWSVVNYRESYGMFAANGILFNHESPVRGHNFVTRKITQGVAAIAKGEDRILTLGNLDAERDWGHARDYVDGMWRILQHHKPEDFVLGTGQKISVRRFVELAFSVIDRQIIWTGNGTEEKGHDAQSGALLVAVDPEFYRPAEVHTLLSDPSKARSVLKWSATTPIETLIQEMVEADISEI